MTQDEIIEMAEKTGVAFASEEYPDIWQTYMHVGKKELEALAKLVAEKEREAIIDLVDSYAKDNNDLVTAIRARGQA